jgi:5-methylcytosine-specific restriction endonuclease McrA
MSCRICGNKLTGRQKETCSKPCRRLLDMKKRRDAGRLRKENLTTEQYARKLASNKKHSASRRANGLDKILWQCVTCNTPFKVKLYSSAGYWCSQGCRAKWASPPTPKRIKFYCARCAMCDTPFVTAHRPGKYCRTKCAHKARPTKKWIATRTREALYERDQWTCQLCNQPVPKDLEYSHNEYQPLYPSLDHIVPRSHGGTDDPTNLQLAHVECNRARGNNPLTTPP